MALPWSGSLSMDRNVFEWLSRSITGRPADNGKSVSRIPSMAHTALYGPADNERPLSAGLPLVSFGVLWCPLVSFDGLAGRPTLLFLSMSFYAPDDFRCPSMPPMTFDGLSMPPMSFYAPAGRPPDVLLSPTMSFYPPRCPSMPRRLSMPFRWPGGFR